MNIKKDILVAIIILLILVPTGFYTKIYSGAGHEWINNKLGGVLYEIFWCLVFYIILPKSKPVKIAIWVLIITCILEFVQLLDNAFLEIIRSNFIGQTIIGNSFTWNDFPYYFIGSVLGYLILKNLEKYKLLLGDK
ncbi:MAG: DUF2809 domain-containing protein [Bacteroidales bacterium]|nr:DUF2809 domain-containing protein [Bacteroidales bacterium]